MVIHGRKNLNNPVGVVGLVKRNKGVGMARIKKRQRKKNEKRAIKAWHEVVDKICYGWVDAQAPVYQDMPLVYPLRKIGMHLVREVDEEEK